MCRLCIWTVTFLMKSKIRIFKLSSWNVTRICALKWLEFMPFVPFLDVYFKWILFLAVDAFREWIYCRDGELFAKNAFFLCSPQTAIDCSNNLPEMAMATKSIVAILRFCCINIAVLLTDLHKKMKGLIREVLLNDVWGTGKVTREELTH